MSSRQSECPDCPYADRGDFVVYRDEWDRVHRELDAARKELLGRALELEKLYAVLNTTRIARDTLANYIEQTPGVQVYRDSGMVVT